MSMPIVQVIFHIDEIAKWPMVLANVKNLLKVADKQSSKIVVLANAKAVSAYTTADGEYLSAMQALSQDGASFEACKNSLTSLQIEPHLLSDFVTVVNVGVLELIEKQAAGYAYIRP